MKYSEFESIKNLEKQISGLKLIIKVNKVLRFVGLGSKKIADLEKDMKKHESQFKELTETPQQFNEIFSSHGWIAHESLSHELMKNANQAYLEKGIDEAEKIILDSFKPENIEYQFLRLKSLPALQKRYRFIEYARQDYIEKRYYSTIPLLIMIIDGTVNEIIGKGFHTETSDIDVWESITNIDNGIFKIRDIFRKGRNKTRDEEISLPFRNGILHGMDLGYDNYVVAAKCWHFLFVIYDWAKAKESEQKRKDQFIKDSTIPSFRELGSQLIENSSVKKALSEWKKREITDEYLSSISKQIPTDKNLPETIAIEFIDLWMKKNYGYMAKMYHSRYFIDGKPNIRSVKDQFTFYPLNSFQIKEISDDASGITEIGIIGKVNGKDSQFIIRMIYEDKNGDPRPRNMNDGNWRIIGVREDR